MLVRSSESGRRYYELDPERVLETISSLSLRIGERFPGSGLSGVARELVEIGKLGRERMDWIGRPIWAVRGVTVFVIAMLLLGLVVLLFNLKPEEGVFEFTTFIGLLEAGLNDLVMLSVGIFFLVTLETRIKRKRALEAIHELRSIAHVIDMHQLTKDPERLRSDFVPTDATVDIGNLDRSQMEHYLEYCSELLSLIGKVAALCAEESQDSLVLTTVSDLETLTTSMSRKVWQKISLLPRTG